jgi:hypothetical protein
MTMHSNAAEDLALRVDRIARSLELVADTLAGNGDDPVIRERAQAALYNAVEVVRLIRDELDDRARPAAIDGANVVRLPLQ